MARPLRLGLCALLALAACGGGAKASAAISLQVFGDPAEVRGYRALIREFERVTPGITVRLTPVASQGDHMTRLATAFSGGSPPDLFLINYRRFGQFAGKGVLEPLGSHLERSTVVHPGDFYEQALEAFRLNGVQLCLPQNISSLVVYWNRALFRSAGAREPRAGWTWDDFVRAARTITRDADADGRADVYGLGVEPNLVRLAPFVWQSGGEVVDDPARPTRITLGDPDAIAGVRFFGDLTRVHHVVPTLEEVKSEDLESRFANGRLGMMLDSRRLTPVLRAVPNLDWDVAPLPVGERAATMLHSDAYCMSKSSPRKAAAFRFVEFALGPAGAALVARSGRTVPSVRSVAESAAFLDASVAPPSARVFLDAIPVIRRLPNIPAWNEAETKADVVIEEWYYSTEMPELLGLEIDIETAELFTPPPS